MRVEGEEHRRTLPSAQCKAPLSCQWSTADTPWIHCLRIRRMWRLSSQPRPAAAFCRCKSCRADGVRRPLHVHVVRPRVLVWRCTSSGAHHCRERLVALPPDIIVDDSVPPRSRIEVSILTPTMVTSCHSPSHPPGPLPLFLLPYQHPGLSCICELPTTSSCSVGVGAGWLSVKGSFW